MGLSEQGEGPATAVDLLPERLPKADMVQRLQKFLSRARSWFSSRPGWAKILLVLLVIGLLPWLLIAAGLTVIGIGIVGLRRGSLPAFRLGSRAAAAATVLVGLLTVGAGSGLAASVITSESPPTGPSPLIAVPPTSSEPPATATPPPPATATKPTTARPTATVAPTTPRTTRPPAPAPRRPTPKPAPPLTVTIVSLPPAGQGNLATATAETAPSAACSIVVEYKSGPSTAQGLYPKTASATGIVTWTWTVGTRTTPGSWPVTVSCSRSGQTDTAQRFLTVLYTGKPG